MIQNEKLAGNNSEEESTNTAFGEGVTGTRSSEGLGGQSQGTDYSALLGSDKEAGSIKVKEDDADPNKNTGSEERKEGLL